MSFAPGKRGSFPDGGPRALPWALVFHPVGVLIRGLQSTICHLPSAICHLPSAIYHLPSAIFHLPSSICHLPSAISPGLSPLGDSVGNSGGDLKWQNHGFLATFGHFGFRKAAEVADQATL
jgi:hypothetical protein